MRSGRPTASGARPPLEAATWDEAWIGVAADAFGGVYLSGVRATSATTFDIATTHRSLYPHGAFWTYDWTGPTPAANVAAGVATRGTLVAVVGSGRTAAGWNQSVLVWKY